MNAHTLRVDSENPLHKILLDFCDKGVYSSACQVSAPFILGDYAYATDCRSMARIKVDPEDAEHATQTVPDTIQTRWDQWWKESGKWKPLPTEPMVMGDGPCPECCEEPWIGLCPHCHTEIAHPSCPTCLGLGAGQFRNVQMFGEKRICVTYMRKLQRIPGAKWKAGLPGENPILIRGKGIEAMVMPLIKE